MTNRIDELEKEPAYKGLKLMNTEQIYLVFLLIQIPMMRCEYEQTTFLHDNVD